MYLVSLLDYSIALSLLLSPSFPPPTLFLSFSVMSLFPVHQILTFSPRLCAQTLCDTDIQEFTETYKSDVKSIIAPFCKLPWFLLSALDTLNHVGVLLVVRVKDCPIEINSRRSSARGQCHSSLCCDLHAFFFNVQHKIKLL